ncbi:MAG: NAD(P)-dependent oxidoreductase [Thalassobaculaceae bacterium]|nr:NAD(P)-dependent oxidoreductase [Thalassobaculaceae bacterium]
MTEPHTPSQPPAPPPLRGWRIGIVGLGLMGEPMARRLAAAGAELSVWNRSIEKAEALAAALSGVTPQPSPRHVAEAAEIVIVMVTDAEAVRDVVFDPVDDNWGVHHGLGEDAVLIDMGTTGLPATRDFAGRLRMTGAHWVDAPVSGGTTAAEDGSLTIMVGASDPEFARIEPMLKVLGRRITHVGAVGAGQVAKTANQMIVGMTIGAVAEALALGKRAGVEPAVLREAIMGGFAHSRILELHGDRMATGDFRARAKATIQRKDMRAAVALAEEAGIDLPGLMTNAALWEAMVDGGLGELDHSALILAIDPPEEA